MSLPSEAPAEARPVRSPDDLEAYFEEGGRPPADWRIGVEYETPVVDAASGEAVPYEGPSGIEAVLKQLQELGPWQPVTEENRLIALRDGMASITLEPGGQVEMSGRPWSTIHECRAELDSHTRALVQIERGLGVRFLGIGITPSTPLERMPWMPKQRYRIMRQVMLHTGRLGHRMMQQTATVQSNFDYQDEADARRKFRVAMGLAPILVAVSANSPVVDGRPTGYKSYRAHVWTDTDPSRCGILGFAFDTEALFHAYTQYALDVPMYFILREGRYVEAGGISFRRFLREGLGPHRARIDDWTEHLATLFPETRLKKYIEIRSPDGQPASLVLTTPALLKGLLYEDDCLTAAWDVLRGWPLDQRREAFELAARQGLDARPGRHRLREYARELVEIATEGLRRQAAVAEDGKDERVYLEPLAEMVAAGQSPADLLPALDGDVQPLIDAASFTRGYSPP